MFLYKYLQEYVRNLHQTSDWEGQKSSWKRERAAYYVKILLRISVNCNLKILSLGHRTKKNINFILLGNHVSSYIFWSYMIASYMEICGEPGVY